LTAARCGKVPELVVAELDREVLVELVAGEEAPGRIRVLATGAASKGCATEVFCSGVADRAADVEIAGLRRGGYCERAGSGKCDGGKDKFHIFHVVPFLRERRT